MSTQYTIFIHMNATKAWLSLTAEERRQFIVGELAPILGKYPTVSLEFYDAEAFSAHFSDIALIKTEALDDYASLMDDLRKSRLNTVPYFEFVEIIPTVEGRYFAIVG